MGILMLKAGRLAMRRVVHRKNQRLISAKSRSKSTTSSTKNVKIVADDGKTVSTPNVIPTLSVWQRLGPISTGINAYARAQQKRPYVTQLFSSLVIYFCGDLSAQRIGDEEYNPWRAIRSMITGGICSIPSYKWYVATGFHEEIMSLKSCQVYVSGTILQLFVKSFVLVCEGCCQPDRLHANLQQLFLWRTVPSCRWWPGSSLGQDQSNSAYQHRGFMQVVAGCYRFQFYLYSAGIPCSYCRWAWLLMPGRSLLTA